MSSVTVTVPTRFSGPIGFANGGWIAGMLAQASGLDPAEVTLRRPIPLAVDLELHLEPSSRTGLHEGRLTDGDSLIAEVRAGEFQREAPEFVTHDEAVVAEQASLVRSSPEYGLCLVCGVDRPDGYRLRPGAVTDRPGTVACLWHPALMEPHLPADDSIPATWAALDCPGAWTIDVPRDPMLLGRMTASTPRAPVLSGDHPLQEAIVVARLDAREGRKMLTSTALYSTGGDLLARAEQVWIAVSTHPKAT